MAYLEYRPRQTLVQYTTAEGLHGILRSKRLWVSDLRAGNDPRELDLGYDKIIEAVKWVAENELQAPQTARVLHLVGRLDQYFKTTNVYSLCFSLAEDFLPMWREYGENHGGVAIGFRPSAIIGMPARIQKVRYVDPRQGDEAFRMLARGIVRQLDLHYETNDIEHYVGAAVDAITAATAVKHITWEYEQEVRVVFVQKREKPEGVAGRMPLGELPKGELVYWREPFERQVRNRAVKYLEFDYGRFRDGKFDPQRAIKSVMLGPNCPLSVAEVEAELKQQNFADVVVQQSNCRVRV